jgi:hypothetical protein
MGDETELNVKEALTSFNAEAIKFGELSRKIQNLTEEFQRANQLYEGLKAAKKRGDTAQMRIEFLNPNYSRWDQIPVHSQYAEEFFNLSTRMIINILRDIKAQIDYLIQVQK